MSSFQSLKGIPFKYLKLIRNPWKTFILIENELIQELFSLVCGSHSAAALLVWGILRSIMAFKLWFLGISDTPFYGFCHFVPKADLSILYEHDILVLMSYKNSLRLFLEGEYCHKFQFDRKSPSISPFYRPIWCKIGGNVAYFFCVPKRGNTYI